MIVFPFIVGKGIAGDKQFDFNYFLLGTIITLILLFGLYFLVPYIIGRIKLNGMLKKERHIMRSRTLTITEEGLTVVSNGESNLWLWETLRDADITDGYLYILFHNNQFYIIPLSAFQGNDAVNFLGILKSNIQRIRPVNKHRKVRNLYYWGLLGFIPNFGAIAGIVLIIRGFQLNKFKLALVGVADISFTVVFWAFIFPSIPIGTGFTNVSQSELNSLVKNIEFYRIQHGQYPDSLKQLLADDKLAPIVDISQEKGYGKIPYFNYQRVGDKYILFSSGKDGIPHTKDDLYPQIKLADSNRIGLIKPK